MCILPAAPSQRGDDYRTKSLGALTNKLSVFLEEHEEELSRKQRAAQEEVCPASALGGHCEIRNSFIIYIYTYILIYLNKYTYIYVDTYTCMLIYLNIYTYI